MSGFRELALLEAARVVKAEWSPTPKAAIVAGSGFGGLASRLSDVVEMPYVDLPGVPTGRVFGHAGRLLAGSMHGVDVVLFDGRAHMYQGHCALDAAFTSRLAGALGAETILLTNAAGGVNPDYAVGDLMLISDSINFTGRTPLEGWTPGSGNPFISMCDAWDPDLRDRAQLVASEQLGRALHEGVYAQVLGPQFETPAEVAMFRALGADVVGMSTVMEAIMARALGMRVLGLSLVTNPAGCSELTHEDVVAQGERSAAAAGDLLAGILQRL